MLNNGEQNITLYRAVSPQELAHIRRFRTYGFSPHGGGKYFAFTLSGVLAFARSAFNKDRPMTITSIRVAERFPERGFIFNDIGGAGESVHFSDEVLLLLYESIDEIEIVESIT